LRTPEILLLPSPQVTFILHPQILLFVNLQGAVVALLSCVIFRRDAHFTCYGIGRNVPGNDGYLHILARFGT